MEINFSDLLSENFEIRKYVFTVVRKCISGFVGEIENVSNRLSVEKEAWENSRTRDLQTAKESNMASAAQQIWRECLALVLSSILSLRMFVSVQCESK